MPNQILSKLFSVLSFCGLLLLSFGATAQCSNNLLDNGDFENGNSTWDGSYTIVYDNDLSSNVVEVCTAGMNARNTISATPGLTYSLTGTAKKPSSINAFIRLKFMNSSYTPVAEEFAFLNNGGYQEYSISATAPSDAAFVEISIQQNGGGSGCVRADNICLTTGVVNPELPDLISEAVVPVVTSVQAGELIGISWDIVNQGTEIPFEDFPIEVDVYLSQDQTVDAGDVLLITSIMGIGSNADGGTVPANLAPGLYYALVDADATNVIEESNENNNVGVSQQRITVVSDGGEGGDIDLSLSLFQSPQAPSQWSTYSVSARVENEGPQAATGVQVAFPIPQGVVYVGGNEFSLSQGSFDIYGNEVWTVGTIPANGFATLTVNYFLKLEESPIAYAQVIAADQTDSDSTPNNGTPPGVNEDDEANGGGAGPSNDKPDLLTSFLTILGSSVSGENLDFEFDLINDGDATASGDYVIGIYLGDDFTIGADDILVGQIVTGNTAVGTISDVQAAAAIPENTPSGNYVLLVRVDNNNDIAELDETNNVKVRSIQVFNPPPPPPPSEGCGFLTELGTVTDATNYGFSAQETSSGYEVAAKRTFFSGGSQTETHTAYLDFNGDVQDFTTATMPNNPTGFVPYSSTLDADAQTLVLTRNLPGGGTDWTTTIDLTTIGEEVLAALDVSAADTPDGTIVGISLVLGPSSSVSTNELYLKLDTNGTLINQDYDDSINDQVFLSDWMIGDNGYVLNYRCSGSCLGFIGVSLDGDYVWNDAHAFDLPSNTVAALTLGPDKKFAYAANRNNQQCYIAKYNIATGENVYTANVNTLFAQGGDYQVSSFFKGLVFTDDGGVVSGNRYFDTGPGDNKYDYGKIDADGELVWAKTIDESRLFIPLIQTTDGGFLFAEEVGGVLTAMKTTSNGDLEPACDGSTPPPPSGNDLPCDLSYTLENGTMTISGPGQNSGHLIVKLFDPSWNTIFSCVDNCGDPIMINNVTENGNYHFSVNTYNPDWSPICDGLVDVPVGGSTRLGIADSDLLRVFPNPARGQVSIDASQFPEDDIQILLVNNLGQQVPAHKLRQLGGVNQYQVDLGGLHDGMYTVWIQRDGKKIIAKKLVVMSGR